MNRIKRLITQIKKQRETKKDEPKETVIISSPMTGTAADLSTAPDEAFASKMMGRRSGCDTEGRFCFRTGGRNSVICFDTKHALGLCDRYRDQHDNTCRNRYSKT